MIGKWRSEFCEFNLRDETEKRVEEGRVREGGGGDGGGGGG